MEHSVLKNLPDNKLCRYVNDTAELYIEHAKKRRLILPEEDTQARLRASNNILEAIWGSPVKNKKTNDGAYDYNRKRLFLGSRFKNAVCGIGRKNLAKSVHAQITAFHEVGHSFQTDNFETLKEVDYFYGETLNDWAEAMVSLSYYKNGGDPDIADAKLEFCYDDLGTGVTSEDVYRWLSENLNYVFRTKDESLIHNLSYSPCYPDVLRLIKTLDIPVMDAIRGATVFGQAHNIKEISHQYNCKHRGRSFFNVLNQIGMPDSQTKNAHLAPLTLTDCQNFAKEING